MFPTQFPHSNIPYGNLMLLEEQNNYKRNLPQLSTPRGGVHFHQIFRHLSTLSSHLISLHLQAVYVTILFGLRTFSAQTFLALQQVD